MAKNNRANNQLKGNHKICVCLDTNIVISMAGMHKNIENEIEEMKKRGQYDDIKALKQLIDKRQVIAIVTPFVLEEILNGIEGYGEATLDYLQKSNIKVLDIPSEKMEDYFTNIEKLALTYSAKLNPDTIRKICYANNFDHFTLPKRVFPLKKNEFGEPCALNDARIMAEASSLGLALITNNTLDFINGHRPEIIRYINQKLHFPSKAIPFTPKDFLRRYKYNQVFATPTSENVKYITPAKDATMLLV